MSHQALAQVQKEVREGNVNERPHGNLCIYKYSSQCVNDNQWNDVNCRCRGIVLDTTTGTIVCKPFHKFHNLNERPSTQTEIVLKKAKTIPFRVTEKLDGSLCNIWFYNGQWQCSTPGSITSEQALYATQHLLPKYNLSVLPTDLTYCCELIAPMDRQDKVVEYKGRDELVLITAFENKWDQAEVPFGRVQYFSKISGLPLVPVWNANYDNFLSLDIPTNTEGYVIAFEDGFRIKVKSIEYVRAFRLISEFSHKHIFDYIESGEYRSAVQALPETKRMYFDDIYAQIITTKGQVELEAQQWLEKCDPTDMKKSAHILNDAGVVKHIVFMLLRGKPQDQIDKAVWKMVRMKFEQ